MTKKYKSYDKIMCRIKIRPKYEGRKARPKAQELNGQILLMQVLWEEDDEDKYPGEYVLTPDDKNLRFKWSEENEVGWIASGDVEILESCHTEEVNGSTNATPRVSHGAEKGERHEWNM